MIDLFASLETYLHKCYLSVYLSLSWLWMLKEAGIRMKEKLWYAVKRATIVHSKKTFCNKYQNSKKIWTQSVNLSPSIWFLLNSLVLTLIFSFWPRNSKKVQNTFSKIVENSLYFSRPSRSILQKVYLQIMEKRWLVHSLHCNSISNLWFFMHLQNKCKQLSILWFVIFLKFKFSKKASDI